MRSVLDAHIDGDDSLTITRVLVDGTEQLPLLKWLVPFAIALSGLCVYKAYVAQRKAMTEQSLAA